MDFLSVTVIVVCVLLAVLLFFVLWKCCYHCGPPTRKDQDSNPGSWVTDSKTRPPTRTDQDSNLGSWVTDSQALLPTRTDQDSNPGSTVTDSEARPPTRTDQDSNPGSSVTDSDARPPTRTDQDSNPGSSVTDSDARPPTRTDQDSNPGSSVTDSDARPPTRTDQDSNPGSLVTYCVQDLKKATENFSNLLGQGGFAHVYRADFGGNKIAAVKRLHKVDSTNFANELSILLRMPRHPNLVNLIGLCSDPDDQMIVFEYVANGTLFSRLHENRGDGGPLSWTARKQIARQVGEALRHLHEKANPPIIHRDVKSKNVLLENDSIAKLADFGIAKLGPKNNQSTKIKTTLWGTFGYMDPQCFHEGKCSTKSDVYSFGVLLLELITGLEALIGSEALVIRTRTDRSSTDTMMKIVDQSLLDRNEDELLEMIGIANRCLDLKRGDRPSMAEVVNMMEGIGNAS